CSTFLFVFFYAPPSTPTFSTLSLHDALPISIRYLLASVPYRNQLNFTFNGLKQAAESVDRLRTFALRLKTERFSKGASEGISERSEEHTSELQSPYDLVCRLLLEKKKQTQTH